VKGCFLPFALCFLIFALPFVKSKSKGKEQKAKVPTALGKN
jgi:hypothetical protein